MQKTNQNESGSAILLIIIITAVIAIFSRVYLTRFDNMNATARTLKDHAVLMATSTHIISTISCLRTYATCAGGGAGNLINFAGGQILSDRTNEGDLISGPWLIHVFCNGGELEISRAHSGLPKINNGDSVNQSGLKWAPLFPDGAICNDCTASGYTAPFPYGLCKES